MTMNKPSYQELVKRIQELENESLEHRRIEAELLEKQSILADLEKTLAALQENEKKYRALVEETDTGFVIIDGDGNVLDANSEYVRLTGHETLEEISGRCVVEWTADYQKERNAQEVAKCLEQGFVRNLEIDYVNKDGIVTPIEINATVIETSVGPQIVTLCRDITRRKQAEETLRQKSEEQRVLLSTIPAFVYFKNRNSKYIAANKAFADMTGTPIDEIAGKTDYDFFPREEANFYRKCDQQVMESGEPQYNIEEPVTGADGKRMWVSTNKIPFFDPDGNVTGMVGLTLDITGRTKAEEEKRSLESQFLQAQKMEAIGTLAGGIAHDFNNLLMGIQGNVSLMLMDMDSTHPHFERLKNIEKQAQSGAKLTSHLLGYARKGKYEVKPVDLNQLAEKTSNTFGRTRKEITIHREFAEDLFAIEADPGQIEQVLLNLFVNAADAMRYGGDLILKTVNATHKDMKGKLYDPEPGNYVLLMVTDTGIGMDKKTMERIFDPFFTTKELGRGTGLGLASAYGIIKGHGGYIDVDSEKGKGTTFSIYLPASEKEVRKAAKIAERFIKGTETVLMVDDEDLILKVGQELLEAMGYRVLIAKDGKEAIEVYEKQQDDIDIVLLDMIMPNMGGGEVYDRMKEINPDVTVLLSSGYSINGEATEILERGCDGFIQKPFNMKKLSGKITEVLHKKQP
jgi:two-component system cell cycle sensor histidine kinase/response regulator CckA